MNYWDSCPITVRISNSCFYFGDKLLFLQVNFPAIREHSRAFSLYFRSIDLKLFQVLPGSSMIRNGGFSLPQVPPLGVPWSWGRWELVPFNEGESGRSMSPTLGQCFHHCITREKHFTEHSKYSSKWKVTASTLWISQLFQCIFDTLWKYPILEALCDFPGHLSWENQNHPHQLQSCSHNGSLLSANNPSDLIIVIGRNELHVKHCVFNKCKPPWVNYHDLPSKQTSK